VTGYGRLNQESDHKPDGDTVFEIGSVTKVFTAILLADMVERGELKLDDPISKFLSQSTKVPTRNGKEITLLDLATHTSGLPRMPNNFAPKDSSNPYVDYTVDQMYAFLSNHTLSRDIGAKYEYSNYGAGLLGHILALKAGMDYETLVKTRICDPLKMNSTRIQLSPELRARLATGHDGDLKAVANWDLPTLAGAGALRSTVNDLLKFLAANLGFTKTDLLPALEKTHLARHNAGAPGVEVGLGWHIYNKHGTQIVWHNGGTGGYHSFIGFDKKKRLGVAVLSNSTHDIDDIGLHLLESNYPLYKERVAIKVDPKILDAYVGVYQINADTFRTVTKIGDRLFMQRTGGPKREILPESETDFFIKDTNAHLTFVKDATGKVIHIVLYQSDGTKDMAPKIDKPVPEERKAIALDPKVYDAYVGQYELTPNLIFTITKEENKLMAQLTGQSKFELFPESETKFFYIVVDAQITFVKDETGQVTHLILHQSGLNQPAKKIK
jgi:CubicO group peptidase (beta-lactamase class C family)